MHDCLVSCAGCLDTVEPAALVDSLYLPARWWCEHKAAFTTWRWAWSSTSPALFSSFQTGETFNPIYLFFFSVSRVQHAGTAWFPAIASTMSTGQSSVSTTGREEACSADTQLHCRATTSCLTRRWEAVSGLRLFWTVTSFSFRKIFMKQKCELNCWWIGEYFLLHPPFFRGLNRVW